MPMSIDHWPKVMAGEPPCDKVNKEKGGETSAKQVVMAESPILGADEGSEPEEGEYMDDGIQLGVNAADDDLDVSQADSIDSEEDNYADVLDDVNEEFPASNEPCEQLQCNNNRAINPQTVEAHCSLTPGTSGFVAMDTRHIPVQMPQIGSQAEAYQFLQDNPQSGKSIQANDKRGYCRGNKEAGCK